VRARRRPQKEEGAEKEGRGEEEACRVVPCTYTPRAYAYVDALTACARVRVCACARESVSVRGGGGGGEGRVDRPQITEIIKKAASELGERAWEGPRQTRSRDKIAEAVGSRTSIRPLIVSDFFDGILFLYILRGAVFVLISEWVR
jgi:hypothetical protein